MEVITEFGLLQHGIYEVHSCISLHEIFTL